MRKIALLVALCLAPIVASALEVKMKLQAIGGGYPQIHGVTNLPDGMPIMVSLSMPGVFYLDEITTVRQGNFYTKPFHHAGKQLEGGSVFVTVTTPLPGRDFAPHVLEAIGQEGEKMTGPLVSSLPGVSGYMVRASGPFEIRYPVDNSARKPIQILELRGH